jgi:hypothetical protein
VREFALKKLVTPSYLSLTNKVCVEIGVQRGNFSRDLLKCRR